MSVPHLCWHWKDAQWSTKMKVLFTVHCNSRHLFNFSYRWLKTFLWFKIPKVFFFMNLNPETSAACTLPGEIQGSKSMSQKSSQKNRSGCVFNSCKVVTWDVTICEIKKWHSVESLLLAHFYWWAGFNVTWKMTPSSSPGHVWELL